MNMNLTAVSASVDIIVVGASMLNNSAERFISVPGFGGVVTLH